MKNKLSIVFAVAAAAIFSASAATPPDFAFPKRVAKNASSQLSSAMRRHDEPAALRSLLDLIVADALLEPDSIDRSLERIAAVEPSATPALRAMLLVLSNDILAEYYDRNRYAIARRTVVEDSVAPARIALWNARQFENKIYDNISRAIASLPDYRDELLSRFASSLTMSDDAVLFYPREADFVVYRSLKAVGQLATQPDFPIPLLAAPANVFMTVNTTLLSRSRAVTAMLYQTLLSLHPTPSAPRVAAEISRLKWAVPGPYTPQFRSDMIDLSAQYEGELAVYPLLEIANSDLPMADRQTVCSRLRMLLPQVANKALSDQIDTAFAHLTKPSISLSFPEHVAPGKPFEVAVSATNSPIAEISLYELVKSGKNAKLLLGRKIDTRRVDFRSPAPFAADTVVSFTAQSYGYYTVVADAPGIKDNRNQYFATIRCTSLTSTVATTPQSTLVVVRDLYSGEPMPGVAVTPYKNDAPLQSVITDSNGFASIPAASAATVSKGADIVADKVYINRRETPADAASGSIITSLPVYHPGDSVAWMATIWQTGFNRRKVFANQKFKGEVRDASYSVVDTFALETDSFGRIIHTFRLPEVCMAGRFTIQIEEQGRRRRTIASRSFEVADYKLPTFYAEVDSVERRSDGSLFIAGLARTYAGFPVADAAVSVAIAAGQRARWSSNTTTFETASIQTDSLGRFSFSLSKQSLELSPYPSGIIEANFDITAESGESHSCSRTVALGLPYSIFSRSCGQLSSAKPVTLPFDVVDAAGNDVAIPLNVKVLNDSIEVLAFSHVLPDTPVNLDKLSNGHYKIVASPVDSLLAAPASVDDILIYDTAKPGFPSDIMLWTDSSNLTPDSRTFDLQIASGRDSLRVLEVVATECAIISTRWLTLSRGFNKLTVSVPDTVGFATVSFSAVSKMSGASLSVDATFPEMRRAIQLHVHSFRDKVVPGSPEQWTIRVTPASVSMALTSLQSACVLNIFSKAISDISQQPALSLGRLWPQTLVRTFMPNLCLGASSFGLSYFPANSAIAGVPDFNLYGYSLLGENVVRYFSSNVKIRGSRPITEMKSAMATETTMDMAAGALVEEDAADDNGSIENNNDSEPNRSEATTVELRPSEEPLALFRPDLTTDPDGSVTVSFSWPRSASTWIVNAAAWTRDMLAANKTMATVAARPMMLSSLVPRFVRGGDRAMAVFTVMNDTDSTLSPVVVRVEYADAATLLPVSVVTDTIEIAPKSQKVVRTLIPVPQDSQALIVRATADNGSVSDGEQSMIPILPATEPLVETIPFFLPQADSQRLLEFDVENPGQVTLQYCANPDWSVVGALPSLRSSKPVSSTEAAANIFAASVARGLIARYPSVTTAIRRFTDTPADSTVAALMRNPDLKNVLLEATPWMADAMNENERLARLAALLDPEAIRKNIAEGVETLARLQCQGGGWSWGPWSKTTSTWATQSILSTFAMLRSLNMMQPDERLDRMVRTAVEYLDRYVIDCAAKAPARQPYADFCYTSLRKSFPEIRIPSAAARVTENTIQQIISNYRNMGVAQKAQCAIILNSYGYASTARQLMESVTDFATERPDGSVTWGNLDTPYWWIGSRVSALAIILRAYHTLTPSSPMVAKVRTSLLFDKMRNEWGSSGSTADAIAAILISGAGVSAPALSLTAIRVDGQLVEPDRVDNATGEMRSNITSLVAPHTTVSVDKASDNPAYGAIYIKSTPSIRSIRAVACDGFSVEKRMLVRTIADGSELWHASGSAPVGARIRVAYTIVASHDLSYVVLDDPRAACLEPVMQLASTRRSQGVTYYQEPRNSSTRLYFDYLPKGTYIIETDYNMTFEGQFASGAATIQSLYAPQYAAHSAGDTLTGL